MKLNKVKGGESGGGGLGAVTIQRLRTGQTGDRSVSAARWGTSSICIREAPQGTLSRCVAVIICGTGEVAG